MSFLSKLLGVVSGNSGLKISEQLLFDKVIGFRGVVPGVGTSTIVQNTAIALSEKTNYAICILDTSYLYPTQYPMLVSAPDKKRRDYLDFSGDISEVTLETSYKNIHLLSLYNRTIVDMLSSKDSELTVDKVIGALKSYFDIILIDLSYELTNITTHFAVKCNKIVNIADQSLKCVYSFRKSINTMSTLAIPTAKANKVIINKAIPDVLTNTKGVIEDAGLTVLGQIPFSLEIAKQGVSGKRIWGTNSHDGEIGQFTEVINLLLDDLIQVTPLNKKFTKFEGETELQTEVTDVEEEVPMAIQVKSAEFINDDSVDFVGGGILEDGIIESEAIQEETISEIESPIGSR